HLPVRSWIAALHSFMKRCGNAFTVPRHGPVPRAPGRVSGSPAFSRRLRIRGHPGNLPPTYAAWLKGRGWVPISERTIGPGGIVHVPHDEIREPFVEIYVGPREQRRLVTTIEVLSPANKTPGAHGRKLYLRKQREILESQVHLVEIDLLRAGPHTTAVPEER